MMPPGTEEKKGKQILQAGNQMTIQRSNLELRLKGLGFTLGTQMKLYGETFEVASEPIIMAENLVLVDAIETKSGKLKRVRIPLPILKVATGRVA
jgi:hypothetical protein